MNGKYDRVQDNEKIVEDARNMKRAIGNEKDYSDMEDLQRTANYFGCKFTVYDNLFRIIKDGEVKNQGKKVATKSPLIGEEVKLQFIKNHCCLMVSRTQYHDFAELHQRM